MQLKTHIAIVIAAILAFLPYVTHKFVFVSVAFLTAFLPDIDSAFSFLGRFKGSRIVQLFFKHRGVFHSLTFCLLLSILLALFLPILAFPFFLSYSLHIFTDSFTKQGVMPFWPWKKPSKWKIKTGGMRETTIFVIMLFIDLLLLVFVLRGFI